MKLISPIAQVIGKMEVRSSTLIKIKAEVKGNKMRSISAIISLPSFNSKV